MDIFNYIIFINGLLVRAIDDSDFRWVSVGFGYEKEFVYIKKIAF